MKTKKNNILVILICAYYMEYSFANNLKIKKYYKEPEGTYNLVSTVVFRLENNYKPMSNYHDKFMFMLQNFKRTFRGNYYLRVYFDRSIYVKTDNDIINKEIDEMWKPLLKYLKSLSFVQLVRYNHLDFKKNKTFHDGLFGTLIRKLNAHPVSGKAQDVAVFKTVVRLMKEGKKVIIFPEGKRSKNGGLQPIKPGISMLIFRTNAAVIPAYIHGGFSIWPSSKKLPKLFGKTACVFGKPLHFVFPEEEDSKERQEKVAKEIESAILRLRKWYEEGAVGTPP